MYAIRSYYEIMSRRLVQKVLGYFALTCLTLCGYPALAAANNIEQQIEEQISVITSYSIHYTKLYEYLCYPTKVTAFKNVQ